MKSESKKEFIKKMIEGATHKKNELNREIIRAVAQIDLLDIQISNFNYELEQEEKD